MNGEDKMPTGWIIQIEDDYLTGYDRDDMVYTFSKNIGEANVYVGVVDLPTMLARLAKYDHPAWRFSAEIPLKAVIHKCKIKIVGEVTIS